MNDLTALKIELTMLAIASKRLRGELNPDAQVTPWGMARVSHEIGVPVAERTFRRATDATLGRARLALEARLSR